MSDERYEISTDKWGDPTINGRRAIEWSDTAMVDAIRQQSRDIEQLRAELNRERETNAGLRRDLADPPPDIQELALKKCGHFEIVTELRAELAAAVAERDNLRKCFAKACATRAAAELRAEQAEARLAAIAELEKAQTPAPVAEIRDVVVTDEMCDRAYIGKWRGVPELIGHEPDDEDRQWSREWLEAWRSELGPALGLVEIREPTPEECERIHAFWLSAVRCIGRTPGERMGGLMFNAVRAVMWPKSEGQS